jgi:signal transduction histidine kinase
MPVKTEEYLGRIQQLENELSGFQTAVKELKVLNEIALAAGRAVNLDQTLKLILNKTISAVSAEHGAIILISENQEAFKTFIKQENNSRVKKTPHIGEHINGWVLSNKKSLIIKDLINDTRFRATEAEKENIKSLICSPIWFEGKIIGILQMLNKKIGKDEPYFTDNDLTLLSIISVQAGQLIKNSELQQLNLEKKKEAENTRLRAEKAEYQVKRAEAEKEINEHKIRTRIAADLHDEIASNLSSISMFSKIVIQELGKNPEIVLQFLERISAISQGSINSIRDIIWAIDPKPESIYDLLLRLKDNYVSICQASSIDLNFYIPRKEDLPSTNLSPEQRKNIWLILKESLNNSVKHSSCRNISVTFCIPEKSSGNISITIKDNGKGFDAQAVYKGKGLETIKKRAEDINSVLNIYSKKEDGTAIHLNLEI